jgi:peptidyl-tRNA hydrolase
MFHAARQFAEEHPDIEGTWFRESNTIVLLEVPDEATLRELASRARDRGVAASEFSEEPDLGLTALALGPEGRRLVSSLPLALK